MTGPSSLPRGWHAAGPTLATHITDEHIVLDNETAEPQQHLNRAQRRAAARALTRRRKDNR